MEQEKNFTCCITGTGLLWPKGKIIFKPGEINVYILPPLDPNSFLIRDNKNNIDLFKSAEAMTNALETRIKEKIKDLS